MTQTLQITAPHCAMCLFFYHNTFMRCKGCPVQSLIACVTAENLFHTFETWVIQAGQCCALPDSRSVLRPVIVPCLISVCTEDEFMLTSAFCCSVVDIFSLVVRRRTIYVMTSRPRYKSAWVCCGPMQAGLSWRPVGWTRPGPGQVAWGWRSPPSVCAAADGSMAAPLSHSHWLSSHWGVESCCDRVRTQGTGVQLTSKMSQKKKRKRSLTFRVFVPYWPVLRELFQKQIYIFFTLILFIYIFLFQ